MNYTDLIAWRKAVDLVIVVYDWTEPFPPKERFGLTNQMRRAATSIPSNIAEGQGRSSTKDYVHFLRIARGSLQELETQIYIANRLKYLSDEGRITLLSQTTEVSRLISGLARSLSPPDS